MLLRVVVKHEQCITYRDHDMEMFPVLLALYEGNTPVTGGSPHKGPVMHSFNVVFIVNIYKDHDMEMFPALLALCEGNPPVTGGFPSQRASIA